MTEAVEKPADPTPRRIRVGRLNTFANVRRELVRLYADLRNGRVCAKTAGTGAYVLSIVSRTLEGELFEARLSALEDAAEVHRRHAPASQVIGHA